MEDIYLEKLVAAEQSVKTAHKRIDSLENDIKDIHDLACSVKEIASEMKAMREDVGKIDIRVNNLEEKPTKNWENLTKTIVTCIATAVAGYFLAKMGLG